MTCGIYALYWPNSSLVYIGKSINVERRTYAHLYELKTGKHCNKKLINQFTFEGNPEIILLEACSPSKLAELESSWILEFDSVNSGLNIADADGVSYSGVGTKRSKYSKYTILKVFSLLYKNTLSKEEIIARTNTNKSLLLNIEYNGQHMWLQEQYPVQYQQMLRNREGRLSKSKSGFNNPRSKYSKVQVLKVFSLLYRTKLSRYKIAARLKVSEGLVKGILHQGTHQWLKEEYPEQYSQMLSLRR